MLLGIWAKSRWWFREGWFSIEYVCSECVRPDRKKVVLRLWEGMHEKHSSRVNMVIDVNVERNHEVH